MANKSLKESEEKFKYLFENSAVGKSLTLPSGELNVNNTMCAMLGYTADELKGKAWQDITHPDDIEYAQLKINELLSGEKASIRFNKRYIKKDGSILWVDLLSSIRRDVDGKPLYFMTSIIDISERILAQEALLESQAFLQAAFDNSQAGIAIADAPDGKLRYVNKAGLLIRNKAEEEIIENIDINQYVSSWNILHLDGTPYNNDEVPLARAVLYGETCTEEFVIRRDNNEDRIVLAKAAPIKDADERIIAGIVIFLDITEQKQTEKNIKRQNEIMSSLLKVLPVGVFMVDAETGKPLVANDMARNLLGRGILPDANQKNLAEVYKAHKKGHVDSYPNEEMPIVEGMKGKHSHVDDLVVERPDGTEVLLEIYGTPILDEKGKPWASLVTFSDITEKKKQEEELEYLSYHDQLTGLYNRRLFEVSLKKLDSEENLPISIIMCDVNGLKLINDSFGHSIGDEVLIKTAKIIKKCCRSGDIVTRLGGDEFVVILPRTDTEDANIIINTIKKLLLEEKVFEININASFGVDTKRRSEQSIVEILQNSENYMYRHKLYEQNSTKSDTINIIMNTLFEKSNRESLHSQRVSDYCGKIATEMKFDKDEINKIKIAGLVHDIGKIGIREDILNKPGKLTEEEWKEIKKHPEASWRILSSSLEYSEIARYIYEHHEKWDGSGYPRGLKGNEISIEARIIAIADAYDAMTSERTYRKGLSKAEAISEMKKYSGTQFDPSVVDMFIKKLANEE
jgi:diguanylate cyclase (GGDEF)-like protein/PAS domain S-box-containing protein